MMGALQKYVIEVEADTPPTVLLGQNLFGGRVTALKIESFPKLVPISWIIERYSFAKSTIIKKLEGHNQGTEGKHLYDPKIVDLVLKASEKSKRGAKRVN